MSPCEGVRRNRDGFERVYYCGHWVKTYPVPEDNMETRLRLIESLTRRLFNNSEHGMDIPGHRIDEIRASLDGETEPDRLRSKTCMLAGATFNLAVDIFRAATALRASKLPVGHEHPLMLQCGDLFMEALEMGKSVLHRSGDEGIDELWGEPLKAFMLPLDEFYESRYIKIAMAMRDISSVCDSLSSLSGIQGLSTLAGLSDRLRVSAMAKAETLRTDPVHFDVWAELSSACAAIARISSSPPVPLDAALLVLRGRDLAVHVARARTSMPKSSNDFCQSVAVFLAGGKPAFNPPLCVA